VGRLSAQRIPRPLAIKHGFSWPAFAFSPLWCFAFQLWPQFLVLCVGVLAIILADNDVVRFLALPGFALWCGLRGNVWRRSRLQKDGEYEFVATVTAESATRAASDVAEGHRARRLGSSTASIGLAVTLPPVAFLFTDAVRGSTTLYPALYVGVIAVAAGVSLVHHNRKTAGIILLCWAFVVVALGLYDNWSIVVRR